MSLISRIKSSRSGRLLLLLCLLVALCWRQGNAQTQGASPPAQPAQVTPASTGLETSALINQQLDAPIDLQAVSKPLPTVLRAIEDKSKVPIFVSDETYALLPYGRETPINVAVKNAPLRQTLVEIGSRLGLEYALRKENVELRPLPALGRAGRRATVQELAGLDLLRQVPLDLDEDRPTAARLLEAVDLKLQEQDARAAQRNEPEPGFQIENRLDDALLQRPVFVARHSTLLSALEALAEQTKATWVPWGDSFIVLPKEEWIRRRLEAPVNLSYNQVDVSEALLELQQAARVPFIIEPGALQRIPERARRVRLYLSNRSVRDALESLGGVTGLGYLISDEGVYIYCAADGAVRNGGRLPNGAAGRAEQPILLIDQGDGTSLLLYPSDLPEETRQRIEARRREAIQALAQPATQPATEPAN